MRIVLAILCILLVVGLVVSATGGYVLNIMKLAKCDFEEPFAEEVFRIAGVPIAPLGIILGYLDMDGTPAEDNSEKD